MLPEGLDPTSEAELDNRELPEHEVEPDLAAMTRALHGLEAARRRVERDAHRAADELRGKLVLELVPVLDNIDRTIVAALQSGDAPAVVEGMRLVRAQLENLLVRYGVERVEAKHRPFDPAIHDAISVVAVHHPQAHNVVIDQVEPGYRFGERLLRPAKVVVGRYTPPYH
jgi:molecular chaperone GrpE (heat shock protein)